MGRLFAGEHFEVHSLKDGKLQLRFIAPEEAKLELYEPKRELTPTKTAPLPSRGT